MERSDDKGWPVGFPARGCHAGTLPYRMMSPLWGWHAGSPLFYFTRQPRVSPRINAEDRPPESVLFR